MASSSADIFADPYDAQDVRDGEEGDGTLADHGIEDGDVIHLLITQTGC